MKAGEERVVKTLCRMCGVSCGMDAYVKEGKLVRWEPMPEHPYYGGKCPKWFAIGDLEYSTQRLTNPLKRVNGGWQRITWDEAFSIIVNKLTEIKEKYGPESFAFCSGHPHINSELTWLVPRLCDAFGSPNFPIGGNYCYMPRTLADYITFGYHMLPNYQGTTCAVFWAANRLESNPSFRVTSMIRGFKAGGIKIIVIDPRRTELAKMADIYLPVRPGTDGALALGMINVIISEELYDKDFVEEWTIGFDKLAEVAKDYTPEKVAKITWVPANLIVEAARMYATLKPASIDWGVGNDQHTNTHQTNRAISCLKAITGNVDKPGASTYIETPAMNLRLPGRVKAKAMGQEEFPVYFDEFLRKNEQQEVSITPLIDYILSDKIKAVIFSGKEVVLQEPNTSKTLEALKKLELMVDIDIYMSETAKQAHIVLPAATFLECSGLRTYYAGRTLGLIALFQKAVEPVGECMPDTMFVLELAKRLGLGKDFPWKDEEELFDYMLRQIGTTLEYLKEHPGGYFFEPGHFGRYKEKGFDTESGKVELYSEKLKRHGYPPVPVYVEPAESPVSTPDIATDYPLVMTSGAKTSIYEHSAYRYLPRLRAQFPEPLVEINPADAGRYGIFDGDLVEVESPRGRIKVKAAVTDDMREGVVHVYHGWPGEANVNLLTLDKPTDPVNGSPGFRSSLCRVRSLHRR